MMTKIEDDTRRNIAEFLPSAIAKSLESYARFSDQEAPGEAKDFTAHHNACKVAIAHIELLIKMARWADVQTDSADNDSYLAQMISAAQDELNKYNDE